MSAIEIGQVLTCNDLQVCFWDECVDPPVKRDPYAVLYSVGFYEGCTDNLFQESINQTPLTNGTGCYWVPKLTNYDANLVPGQYFIKWAWKDDVNSNWQQCRYNFTVYTVGYCLPNLGRDSKCATC